MTFCEEPIARPWRILEARVPYLDRRVVELANTLSDQACVRLFP